jgi:hypothetical protein
MRCGVAGLPIKAGTGRASACVGIGIGFGGNGGASSVYAGIAIPRMSIATTSAATLMRTIEVFMVFSP